MNRLDKIFVAGCWYTIVSDTSAYPLLLSDEKGNRHYFDGYSWSFVY